MRYDFIRREEKAFPVTLLCKVMQVGRSGFYSHVNKLKGKPKELPERDRFAIKVFEKSKGTYGKRRIAASLNRGGYTIGLYATKSLMKRNNLKVVPKRRFKRTTDSRHKLPVAPDLLQRDFQPVATDKAWVGDITYVWTKKGWLYLAVLIDLYSRLVVGWAMSKNIDTALVSKALLMACWQRRPEPGLIHHTDRGSQYASKAYSGQLTRYGLQQSMSRKGNCWDNAPAESFFGTLKSERLDQYIFEDFRDAELEILDYITYYNSDRLHSTLGYVPPMEFEKAAA